MDSGTGSVYQRKDGYWVAAVSFAGRRIVKYRKTKREAQRVLHDMLQEQQHGTLTAPSRLTFSEWSKQWLQMREGDCRPTTLRVYAEALALVSKHIGHVRMDRLTPALLARLFVQLRQEGLGSRRIEQCYTVLGNCLRHAVKLGVVGQNPLERVNKPQHHPRERSYWKLVEVRRFLTATETSAPF